MQKLITFSSDNQQVYFQHIHVYFKYLKLHIDKINQLNRYYITIGIELIFGV